jgi:N-acetylglucosaminyldiphosphoundecaprenol N-acetyl-beta-D-mannosaminyltransferase
MPFQSILLMKKRISLFGLPVDALTMEETINVIENSIDQNEPIHHVVVNAAKMVNAQKDSALQESIVNCDIINADGQAVVWAAKILKQPLPERVAGIDLMELLVKLSAKKNYKIYFLGAQEEVVKKVVDKYSLEFGEQIIAGYRNGYFSKEEEIDIAKEIAISQPDILFVAISSPKKEIFLNKHKDLIRAPFVMGVGGSFDVVSGLVKRAPRWMQQSGLEWLYRVYQEPRRMWKRYLITNSKFIGLVINTRIKMIFSKNIGL